MKTIKIACCLFLLLSEMNTLQAQHKDGNMFPDKPSTHGMLIFGTNKIYASHMPLFHTPHDYQIILELELNATSQKKFIEDQQLHPEFTTYTIEPEKFVLPEMIAHPRPFKANLYRGHFERGLIDSNVQVSIAQVLYFKKFDPAEKKLTTTDFIVFGNTKEQFAIHEITNKPDFEQVILIRTNLDSDTGNNRIAMIVTLNAQTNNPVGVSGNTIDGITAGKKRPITLLKQLYLEFEDLTE